MFSNVALKCPSVLYYILEKPKKGDEANGSRNSLKAFAAIPTQLSEHKRGQNRDCLGGIAAKIPHYRT